MIYSTFFSHGNSTAASGGNQQFDAPINHRPILTEYGFPAKPGEPNLPDNVPDGEYPMVLDGKLDLVRIERGKINCTNFAFAERAGITSAASIAWLRRLVATEKHDVEMKLRFGPSLAKMWKPGALAIVECYPDTTDDRDNWNSSFKFKIEKAEAIDPKKQRDSMSYSRTSIGELRAQSRYCDNDRKVVIVFGDELAKVFDKGALVVTGFALGKNEVFIVIDIAS